MYHCTRITSALEVIEHWPFLRYALGQMVKVTKSRVDHELCLKILFHLATDLSGGFVGIVFEDSKPIGFGAMEDISPIFSTKHTFLCRAFWHNSGHTEATVTLMKFFETWAKTQGVDSYIVTTDRESGAAISCFKSAKYGFSRSHTEYIKTLK